MANRHTLEDLRYLQAMPLDIKVRITKQRIREWIREFGEDGVYVSFSGGKDSTVLLEIVRQDYQNVRAMFVDVPTQYPELKAFVKTFDNVDIVAPKISFVQVCEKYGFPLISKEVSECVYGARKYLRSIAENGVCGGGTPTDWKNSADKASLVGGVLHKQMEKGERSCRVYKWEYEKATGTGRFSPHSRKSRAGGSGVAEKPFDSQGSQELLQKATSATQDSTEQGKAKAEVTPKKDRSQFSCERYQFFLDAPFEISNQCCKVMKKDPAHKYAKETGRNSITAQMAE